MRCRAMLVPILLLLGACTSYRAVTVSVRDGITHEPVPDARIAVRPLHLFSPEYPNRRLTLSPHDDDEATTDTTGSVTVTAPARHPFELFVLIPFEAPRGIEINEVGTDASEWTALVPDAAEERDVRTLEVRVE